MNKGPFNNLPSQPTRQLVHAVPKCWGGGVGLWETPARRSPFPGAGEASRETAACALGAAGGAAEMVQAGS